MNRPAFVQFDEAALCEFADYVLDSFPPARQPANGGRTMTVNGTPMTERTLMQIAEAEHALAANHKPPFDTLHYYVREGYTTEEIVAMVTTNQPVPGKPAEWARNSQRVGA